MDSSLLIVAVGVQFFASAVVAAVVAEDKNRSAVGFFFLALFFLGPFAIAVAILATPGPPRAPLPPLPSSTLKQRAAMSNSAPGVAVKVIAPGDDHEGQTGTMYEVPDDDDDSQVFVKFSGDSEFYAFGRDEIEPIHGKIV